MLTEKTEYFRTPLHGRHLECPVCHQDIPVWINVEVSVGSARVTGGDTFRSNVSTTTTNRAKSVVIEHRCEIKEER